MSDAVFSLPYLGNIEFYSAYARSTSPIIDLGEHFQKQSYRNRTNILGANGVLMLSVPVIKNSGIKQLMSDVKVSYDAEWQRIHIEALKSAYGSSPFFAYYFDEIASIISQRHIFLKDLSLALHEEIMSQLQLDVSLVLSQSFYNGPGDDFRQVLQPKHKHVFLHQPYTQVFSEKIEFVHNLSILDLLFNEGPNAESFLFGEQFN